MRRHPLTNCGLPGLDPDALGLVGWDVYDAVLMPGDLILMIAWKTKADAESVRGIRQSSGRRATAARPRPFATTACSRRRRKIIPPWSTLRGNEGARPAADRPSRC